MSRPKRSVIITVVEDNIIERFSIVRRIFGIGMDSNLTFGVVGAVAIPIIIPTIGTGLTDSRVEARHVGHSITSEVVVTYRALCFCREGLCSAVTVLYLLCARIVFGDEGPIIISRRSREPFKGAIDASTGIQSNVSVVIRFAERFPISFGIV